MICKKCRKEIPEGSKFCNHCGAKQAHESRKALKRANGTGTVYKLQGRRKRPWVAAKNKTIIGYYETKTAALDALSRLSGRDITERYNMAFKDVFEEWKVEHYREIKKSAQDQYDISFNVFEPLHNKKFRSLRTSDFQDIIDQHKDKAYSTISKYKQLITQMSEWAIREDIIDKNFAHYVKLKENVKKEKEIFTDEEIEKLEKDGSETAKIILMLIYTGMRIGELFSLKTKDYHGSYVIGGEKTKAGKDRVIPIRPEGRKYFAYFAEKATGDLLLSGYDGDKVAANFRRRNYYQLLDKLEIERKTPHATRHTFASWARKVDMQPEILQKILGHSSYTVTANTYVHKDIDDLIGAVEVTSGLLSNEK